MIVAGIYVLYFESGDDQFYVGQSVNIAQRYAQHCNALKGQYHRNRLLQSAFNKYNTYPTEVILETTKELGKLDSLEVSWIDRFDSFNTGMNLTPGGGKLYGNYNPAALYTNEVYLSILHSLAYTDKTFTIIAKDLDVSINVVSNTSCGTSNTFLQEVDPIAYSIMEAKSGNRVRLYETSMYVKILETLAYTEMSLEAVGDLLSVSLRVVQDIAWGRRHQHLEKEYPELYIQVLNKVGTRCTGPRKLPYPKLISSRGQVLEVVKAADFALEHNLCPGKLSMVLNGKRNVHKGWKVYQE